MKINTVIEKAEAVQRFDCEYEGEEFWFKAKTKYLTPRLAQTFTDTKKDPIKIAEGLAMVVTDWSIEKELIGDDGEPFIEPFPPTKENLSITPIDFLNLLVEKISEVWSGNAQRPKPSANGSAASAK